MHHSAPLQEIVLLLAISVVSVAMFRRLNLPPVLAYLFVGILVGPHGWAWIADTENTRFLAEFGVVFLMFTVGLEFSLPQLIAMRKEVFGIGGAQVILTTLLVMLVLMIAGQNVSGAFIVGGVIALSSTAMVIKQLTEQLESHSRHGRLSISILIFQDLAVIPFLIIIPALGAGAAEGGVTLALFYAVLKGVFVIALMFAAGHYLLRPLFHNIAKQHTSELFTLTILLFSVAAAWITGLAGLSLALGAFIAGMMLAETEFKHQVEVDIRPFRDVLMGLFFITIGMLLDIQALPTIFPWVLLAVLFIVVLKFAVIMAICHYMKIEKGIASRTGLTLAQGGEFGFAILAIALSAGALNEELSQITLASVIVSMIISPFIIRHNGIIAKRFFTKSYMDLRDTNVNVIKHETESLINHVVICGYGRIGQNVARFLKEENFSYVALDLDPVTVKAAHDAGEPVFYGDTTRKEILQAVHIESAQALVVSYDDFAAASKIIKHTKQIRPDIHILVRTRDDSHLKDLQEMGATEVIPETLEASLMLSSHLLMLLEVPMKKVVRNIQKVRENRYQMLHEFFHGQSNANIDEPDTLREGLHSITLPEDAFSIGKSIDELNLEIKCNIKVTALRHDGICHQKPDSASVLEAGDVIVLYATPEDSKRAEAILLSGYS